MKNQNSEVEQAKMQKDIQYIKKSVDDLIFKVDNAYLTKIEFEPVKKTIESLEKDYVKKEDFNWIRNVIWGIIGTVVTTVIIAGINFFITVPK